MSTWKMVLAGADIREPQRIDGGIVSAKQRRHLCGEGSSRWLSLIGQASQAREYCAAKYATLRAARTDPSLRRERLLGITSKLSRYRVRRSLNVITSRRQRNQR